MACYFVLGPLLWLYNHYQPTVLVPGRGRIILQEWKCELESGVPRFFRMHFLVFFYALVLLFIWCRLTLLLIQLINRRHFSEKENNYGPAFYVCTSVFCTINHYRKSLRSSIWDSLRVTLEWYEAKLIPQITSNVVEQCRYGLNCRSVWDSYVSVFKAKQIYGPVLQVSAGTFTVKMVRVRLYETSVIQSTYTRRHHTNRIRISSEPLQKPEIVCNFDADSRHRIRQMLWICLGRDMWAQGWMDMTSPGE
jgi:hypothetical protein